jgi:hypothetical protein
MPGPDVDEVDADPVDHGGELRQGVQPGLHAPEVVLPLPVTAQRPHGGQLHTLGAVGDELPGRPARRREAAAQVVEGVITQLHAERPDRGHLTYCLSAATESTFTISHTPSRPGPELGQL